MCNKMCRLDFETEWPQATGLPQDQDCVLVQIKLIHGQAVATPASTRVWSMFPGALEAPVFTLQTTVALPEGLSHLLRHTGVVIMWMDDPVQTWERECVC